MALLTDGLAVAELFHFHKYQSRKRLRHQHAIAASEKSNMRNMEIPVPQWRDDEGEIAPIPTPGGVLDGLPEPSGGSSLHFLMSPEDIATIDWQLPLADSGQGHEQAALTIGHVDPGVLAASQTGDSTLPFAGPKNPIGPVMGYPETGKDAWRAGNDDAIVAAANKYNSERHLFSGDAGYGSPGLYFLRGAVKL